MILTSLLLFVIFSVLFVIAIKGFIRLPAPGKKGVLLFLIIGIVFMIVVIAVKRSIPLPIGKDKKMIEGKIIYVVSNKIREIDLASKKEKEVYQGSNIRLFSNLNKINDNRLLLEIAGSIESFDLRTKSFNVVCQGSKPAYIPEINSIFFYKYNKGLYQKKLDSDKEEFITENVYTYSIPKIANSLFYFHSPVQVSPSEIAYYAKDKKIEVYDFIRKTFKQLDITGYEPWTFYKKKNSLICKDRTDDNDNFYFVNISNLQKEKIPPRVIEGCIIPVEDYDCLIYSKVRFFSLSETKDMYIYWINEKKEQKYLEDVFIYSGIY